MKIATGRQGAAAEMAAVQHLQAAGLTLKQKNYTCRHGEIDLIMEHKGELVFVEVRYRQREAYGGAMASVTAAKCKRIRRTADFYLQHYPDQGHRGCRFDVVAVSGKEPAYQCDWVVGAFW